MKQQQLIPLFLLTISSLVFQACQNTPSFTKTAFESPLKDVEIIFETRKIQAEEAQLIRLDNGSSLQIPKDAFVDANGNKVTGKMDLGYRQFDDPADIIASGIPMTFKNEEGSTEQLESGGMFELRGSVGGEPVFVAPGKSIKTTLASSVAGAYDFYYLESDGAAETNTNSKWKKLTNIVDDIPASTFQAPDSFQLKYNIADYPGLKLFEGVEWKLLEDNATWNPKSSANKGVLEEEWNRIEFSQPKMALKKTKTILGGQKSAVSYSPDRTFFIADNDSRMESYNLDGKLLASTNDVHKYSVVNFLSKDLLTYSNKKQNVVFSNKYLKTIGIIENAYCLSFQEETKCLYYLKRNKNDYKSISLEAMDAKGQQLFTKEITMEDGVYSPTNKMFLTNDEKHIYLNVKEGVEILDLKGKRVALLAREEAYETIYYGFDNTRYYNDTYNYYTKHFESSKNKVVTIINRDGSLTIWDWEKNKTYKTKGVDVREKAEENNYNLYLYDNKNHPFVTFREDGAAYSKTWYWEEDRIVENSEDHIEVSPMGLFINVVTKEDLNKESNTFSGNITTYSGKKILSYKEASFVGEGPEIVNYGQEEKYILISIPKGENILYDSKGNMIKNFTAYNKAIFYSIFNYETTLVYAYTLDGLITCWDLTGTLMWETEVNELILDPWDLLICDSSILITGDVNKEYNLKGEMLVDYNIYKNKSYRAIRGRTLQDNIVLGGRSYSEKECFFAKKELLPDDPNVYQVAFYKGGEKFTTFIYLDATTKGLVEKYRAEEQRLKIQELARRDVEMKLKRSFKVQSFGIYNWDRFYKDESETIVRCEAEFNLSTEYNDITVFLITGAEKNAVIQYTKKTFDKFSFNTAFYNKLVAVLPNNEIAIFENEDFKKLDIEKIKATKKHRFEMKKMGGVAALEELKKMTEPPS
jgi:hypothetical protein